MNYSFLLHVFSVLTLSISYETIFYLAHKNSDKSLTALHCFSHTQPSAAFCSPLSPPNTLLYTPSHTVYQVMKLTALILLTGESYVD